MTKWFVAISFSMISTVAMPASYNCNLDSLTAVEKMVCNHIDLSVDDEVISELYKYLKRPLERIEIPVTSEAELKASQIEWLRARDKCVDIECIRLMYSERLRELNSLFRMRQKMSGMNLTTAILKELERQSSYEINFDSVQIYYFGYMEEFKGYGLLFESIAAGYFNSFGGNGTGWCGGDADMAAGLIVVDVDLSFIENHSYIGNGCVDSRPVVKVSKNEFGAQYKIAVAGNAVAEKFKKNPLLSFESYELGDKVFGMKITPYEGKESIGLSTVPVN